MFEFITYCIDQCSTRANVSLFKDTCPLLLGTSYPPIAALYHALCYSPFKSSSQQGSLPVAVSNLALSLLQLSNCDLMYSICSIIEAGDVVLVNKERTTLKRLLGCANPVVYAVGDIPPINQRSQPMEDGRSAAHQPTDPTSHRRSPCPRPACARTHLLPGTSPSVASGLSTPQYPRPLWFHSNERHPRLRLRFRPA